MNRLPYLVQTCVGLLALGVLGCNLLEQDEVPQERRIVLQLDVNPKKLDFKAAATRSVSGAEPATVAPASKVPANVPTGSEVAVDSEEEGDGKGQKGSKRPRSTRRERPAVEPSGPSLEALLMRIERVKLERARRGYHPGDLPAVDQAVARAERLLDEDRLVDAELEISKAQRTLDNFQIDRQYIERRLELLNRDPKVAELSGETLEKVGKLLEGVNQAYLQGDYAKANAIIERIRKIVGAQ